MNYDIKQFFVIAKAVFYQLFNRKMQYAVFCGDPNHDDTIYLTNVNDETVFLYDENPVYCLHKVTIKDRKFLDDLYGIFPMLRTSCIIIRVVDFLSSLSKSSDITKCSLSLAADNLLLRYEVSDKSGNIDCEIKDIGLATNNLTIDLYNQLFKRGLITSEDPGMKMLSCSDYDDGEHKIVLLNDISHPTETFKMQSALVILQPGFNVPTLNTFIKGMKNQTDYCVLVSGYDKNCVIQNYKYDSELLSSYGVNPSQRWFVRNKRQ